MSVEANSIRTVYRAIDVLFCIAAHRAPIGPTEIGRRTGIDRATVRRLLQTLAIHKLAIPSHEAGRYVLGPGLLTLSEGVPDNQIRELAGPHLVRLRDISGESVVLSVLSQNRCTHIMLEASHHAVRWSTEIGASVPLYAGAAGKAMLAFLDEPELERAFSEPYFPDSVDGAEQARKQAKAEIPRIRDVGYAVAIQELSVDAAGIAAPVFDHSRKPIASIGICGPTSRFGEASFARYSGELLDTVLTLSAQLGYSAKAA